MNINGLRTAGAGVGYWTLACIEFDVPIPLLIVDETDAMACKRVWVLDTEPVRVKLMVTSNWPPNAWEAVLENQNAPTPLRSKVEVEAVRLWPEAGLKVTLSEPRLRVVE
jgi:hypothetical protein